MSETRDDRSGAAGILESITLRFGPRPGSEPLTVRPGAMTVLVGPNNSGKSLLLREIESDIKPMVDSQESSLLGLVSPPHSKRRRLHPNRHKILHTLTPQLPKDDELRRLFCESISKALEPLTSENDPNPLGPLTKYLTASLESTSDDEIVKAIPNNAEKRSLRSRATQQRRNLRSMIVNRHLDLGEFCRFLDIDENSNLARVLSLDEPDATKAFEEVLSAGDPELVRAQIEDFRDKGERFQQYLSDPRKGADLVKEGVVNLDAYRHVLAPFTVLLDGQTRLQQTEPAPLKSFYQQAQNEVSALLRNREALENLREHVHNTFGFYLAIDVLAISHARFVAADEHPRDREFSLGPDAIEYFKRATDLREMSDGVRSFVGIHAALTKREYRVILIDEPEAFLHPPLVRRLGFDLTKMAADREASIIAATHSADFVMGCVEAGQGVDVIRLGYEKGTATARALPSADLMAMMRDPLLRSTGVLSALFHRAAVVCEGDSDQAFYAEINERLRVQAEHSDATPAAARPWVRDAVFINAHGKGSVPRLMGALRRVGVPAVAIVDLDLLLDKHIVPELLREAGVSEVTYAPLGEMRSRLLGIYERLAEAAVPSLPDDADDKARDQRKDRVKNKRDKLIKRRGIANLPGPQDQRAAQDFLAALARHGIFVPECGDLESWLPEVSKGMGKSKDWLPTMFERMGMLGEDDYLAPGGDDVWEFLRKIARWIDNSLAHHDWIPTE